MSAPSFPYACTLTGRALAPLVRGEKITHRSFQNKTASYRLSSCVERLRNRHGWPIETEMIEAKTSDPVGRTAKFGVYSINPAVLSNLMREIGAKRLSNFLDAVERFEREAEHEGT